MALTALIFGFNTYRTVTLQNNISLDFVNYRQFVEPMKHGIITKPHFLYPLLVAIWTSVFPGFSIAAAGGIIVIFFQLVLAYILWRFWEGELQNQSTGALPILLTLVAMIVAPVTLFVPDHHEYFGYILIADYHNPPSMICRPLALLNFLIFARVIVTNSTTVRRTLLCAATLVIAALMKPNYALIAVPVAAIFALESLIRKQYDTLKFIILGMLLPGILVLGWQFTFTYFSPHSEVTQSHVIFDPLAAYGFFSKFLYTKAFLSILFPLSTLVVFWKQAIRDRFYLAAFFFFLVGAAQAYLLAESGDRLYMGNFLWSAELGLFLWFIASMRLVLHRLISRAGARRWQPATLAVTVVFSLHVISGVLWYFHEALRPGSFW